MNAVCLKAMLPRQHFAFWMSTLGIYHFSKMSIFPEKKIIEESVYFIILYGNSSVTFMSETVIK